MKLPPNQRHFTKRVMEKRVSNKTTDMNVTNVTNILLVLMKNKVCFSNVIVMLIYLF